MHRSLLQAMDAAAVSLVELAALEALEVIGNEVITLYAVRVARGRSRSTDWRDGGSPPLTGDLGTLIESRLVDGFPDHVVVGAHRPDVITTRWRWLIAPPDEDDDVGALGGRFVSVALLSGDAVRVGAIFDLALGEVTTAHRDLRPADRPGLSQPPIHGPRRLFLESGRSGGGRWTGAALMHLAARLPVEPRISGSVPGALLAASRSSDLVLAVGVPERDLAAGVLIAERSGLEAVWWRDAWPTAHVLVGPPDELVQLLPAVTDLLRGWHAAPVLPPRPYPSDWVI